MKRQQMSQEINNKNYGGDILTLRLVDFAAQAALLIGEVVPIGWTGLQHN